MNYTIVWNEAKNEGVIFSGEHADREVNMAVRGQHHFTYSRLAGEFYDIYGAHEPCTSISLSQPSEDMVKAGIEAYLKDEGKDVAEVIESIYKAMIEKLTCNP